ncbi:MAG: DUF3108 domain-containing protein [Gemmatimonadaceae bacterium]
MPSRIFIIPLAIVLVMAGVASAQVPAGPALDGRFLHPGTDSLAVYVVRGNDTTETGILVDELRVIEQGGTPVVQRVYRSVDKVLGWRLDTLLDAQASLAPIRHRSRTEKSFEFLEYGDRAVTGWIPPEGSDSARVQVVLPSTIYNSSSLDLVVRALPLREGWEATIPAFVSAKREIAQVQMRVAGSEVVGGEECWRVDADFMGLPVTFWVGKDSRALRQQTMRVRPDVMLLFRKAGPGSGARHIS